MLQLCCQITKQNSDQDSDPPKNFECAADPAPDPNSHAKVGSVPGGLALMTAAGFILVTDGDEPELIYPQSGPAAPASLTETLKQVRALAAALEEQAA